MRDLPSVHNDRIDPKKTPEADIEAWRSARLAILLENSIPWSLKLHLGKVLSIASGQGQQQPTKRVTGSCPRAALEDVLGGLSGGVRPSILAALRAADPSDRELDRCRDQGIRILVPEDHDYPRALHELAQPPLALYVRCPNSSRAVGPSTTAVGMVGPRNADPYGIAAAKDFASALAAADCCVVSGFARGVDITSHRATYGLGTTWALLGCGIDVNYPRQHHHDLEKIVEHGGRVLSEFPLGTQPQRWHFPLRNRLIAALSDLLLVVQATHRSGSLITANAALELGRDVWAIPGRIDQPRSAGTNALIRDGAGVATCPRDLLETLCVQPTLDSALEEHSRGTTRSQSGAVPAGLSPNAQLVALKLRGRARKLDGLSRQLELPIAALFAALGELELGGWVERLGDDTFRWSD